MGLRDWIVNWLRLGSPEDQAYRERVTHLQLLQEYYEGRQKRQLRVKPGKYDDNITVNFIAVLVDKAVSALMGDPTDGRGLSWTFPSEADTETEPPQVTWLNEQWDRNKKEIFLHKNALSGAKSGFPAIKIVPDGVGGIELINLNPLLLTVETDPQNLNKITAYIIRYILTENDTQVQYKEVQKPNESGTAWEITTYKQKGYTDWEQTGPPVLWQYDFPQIVAWQNLPCEDDVYGRSDIEGLIELQNRLNLELSNMSKIDRLYAHPQRYARNLTAQMEGGEFKMGPDEMPSFSGEGEIIQLQPAGDLSGSSQFADKLKEYMYTLAREVDFQQLGAAGDLSNYRMEVMCRDFLDKLGSKRMLYGDALVELNRRLLILGNFEGEKCKIEWPDPLPQNMTEETTALQADMNMGLVSKQTAAESRGYSWEDEQARMEQENASQQNAGQQILTNFFRTGQ